MTFLVFERPYHRMSRTNHQSVTYVPVLSVTYVPGLGVTYVPGLYNRLPPQGRIAARTDKPACSVHNHMKHFMDIIRGTRSATPALKGHSGVPVCGRHKSPKPIIETNPSRDYFTFVLPVHKHFLQSNAKTVHELNGTAPVTVSSTVPVPYQYRTSYRPSSCTSAEAAFRAEKRPAFTR